MNDYYVEMADNAIDKLESAGLTVSTEAIMQYALVKALADIVEALDEIAGTLDEIKHEFQIRR
jgi:hypothetical protein